MLQAISLTVFSWLSHFSQCYILLKCNNSESIDCIESTGHPDTNNYEYHTGTSISKAMVFPTCVNIDAKFYDYLAFMTIHMVFCKFIYIMYYLYTCPEIVFQNMDIHNQLIECDKNKLFIWQTKRSILISIVGIYFMYFTTYTTDPLKSEPSLVREVLVYFHIICAGLIISGTSTLCFQIVREINERIYKCVTVVYLLTLMVMGSISLYLYHQDGYHASLRFMNVGEWEIFYFTYVYYLLSIVTYVYGNIYNTLFENKKIVLSIFLINFIIGPTSYSVINCVL